MRNCNKEVKKKDISICSGYKISYESRSGAINYEPFEKPTIIKVDLCDKHLRMWCELTYSLYIKIRENEK